MSSDTKLADPVDQNIVWVPSIYGCRRPSMLKSTTAQQASIPILITPQCKVMHHCRSSPIAVRDPPLSFLQTQSLQHRCLKFSLRKWRRNYAPHYCTQSRFCYPYRHSLSKEAIRHHYVAHPDLLSCILVAQTWPVTVSKQMASKYDTKSCSKFLFCIRHAKLFSIKNTKIRHFMQLTCPKNLFWE